MSDTNYQQFLAPFIKEDVPGLYKDWHWLISNESLKRPLAMSCFGDLFYADDKGQVNFLDTLEGDIVSFADSEEEMITKLSKPENQVLYLTSESVELLRERGLVLKANELYSYVPHPIITGEVTFNSIQVMDMIVVISVMGQTLSYYCRKA